MEERDQNGRRTFESSTQEVISRRDSIKTAGLAASGIPILSSGVSASNSSGGTILDDSDVGFDDEDLEEDISFHQTDFVTDDYWLPPAYEYVRYEKLATVGITGTGNNPVGEGWLTGVIVYTSCTNIAWDGDNYVQVEDPGSGIDYDGITIYESELNIETNYEIDIGLDETGFGIHPDPINTSHDPVEALTFTASVMASYASGTVSVGTQLVMDFIEDTVNEQFESDPNEIGDDYAEFRSLHDSYGAHEGVSQSFVFVVKHEFEDIDLTVNPEVSYPSRGLDANDDADSGISALDDRAVRFEIGDGGGGGGCSPTPCPESESD